MGMKTVPKAKAALSIVSVRFKSRSASVHTIREASETECGNGVWNGYRVSNDLISIVPTIIFERNEINHFLLLVWDISLNSVDPFGKGSLNCVPGYPQKSRPDPSDQVLRRIKLPSAHLGFKWPNRKKSDRARFGEYGRWGVSWTRRLEIFAMTLLICASANCSCESQTLFSISLLCWSLGECWSHTRCDQRSMCSRMKSLEDDNQSRESPKHPKKAIVRFGVTINCRAISGASTSGGIQKLWYGVQSKNQNSAPIEKKCQAIEFARCKVIRSTWLR
jgi:hypothetical protein